MSRLKDIMRKSFGTDKISNVTTQFQMEKAKVTEVIQDQLREMAAQEEKFDVLEKTRQNTPIIDKLREIHQNEVQRIKSDFPITANYQAEVAVEEGR